MPERNFADEKLTRFEVVDQTGRVLGFGIVPSGQIQVHIQDEERTLKVFIQGKARVPRLPLPVTEEEKVQAVDIMTEAGRAAGFKNTSLKRRMAHVLSALLTNWDLTRKR